MDAVDVVPFCLEVGVLRETLLRFVASLNAVEDALERANDVIEALPIDGGSQMAYLVEQVEHARRFAGRTAADFLEFLADMQEEFKKLR